MSLCDWLEISQKYFPCFLKKRFIYFYCKNDNSKAELLMTPEAANSDMSHSPHLPENQREVRLQDEAPVSDTNVLCTLKSFPSRHVQQFGVWYNEARFEGVLSLIRTFSFRYKPLDDLRCICVWQTRREWSDLTFYYHFSWKQKHIYFGSFFEHHFETMLSTNKLSSPLPSNLTSYKIRLRFNKNVSLKSELFAESNPIGHAVKAMGVK